jgi:hypothetical protein
VATVPDNLADARSRAEAVTVSEAAHPTVAIDARWAAFAEAYENGTISTYYVSGEPNPADLKFLVGHPEPAPQTEPHVPTKNQVR